MTQFPTTPTHATLLVAPAASGKTETVLRMLHEPRRGRALLLVPNELQQQHLRARINTAGIRGVSIHQFYRLARLVMRRTHPDITDLNHTTRAMLIRALLRDLAAQGSLPTFAPVVEKPGFIATIGTLIDELHSAEIDPHRLATAGITPYDTELGAISAAYRATLARLHLADIPRRLSLACEVIEQTPQSMAWCGLLIVDGFDQFTPLQLRLLAALTRAVERSTITLTGSRDHRPAHRRFARTYTQLVEALQPEIIQMEPGSPAPPRAPVLHHIEHHLFNLDLPQAVDAGQAITLIEAADREREVRAALRRVDALLHGGASPERVAVLVRNEAVYEPLLREVAAEYGLPLAIYRGLPLHESPSIIALLTMLRLPLDNFPRRSVVETWRSFADGRLPLDTAPLPLRSASFSLDYAASLLDRAARQTGISSGLGKLQHMLRSLTNTSTESVSNEEHTAVIPAETAAEMLTMLNTFADWLIPPREATIGDYAAWVRERTSSPEPHTEQTKRWLSLLEQLAHAATLLNEPLVSYRVFMSELTTLLAGAHYGRVTPGSGRVAVLSVLAARGLHFDHVVLTGMSEGEFPPALPEPAIYSRRERAALAQHGIVLAPPDPADERSLFYETTARARHSLTLTRTYLDERGNPLQPSPYLNALLDLVNLADTQSVRIQAGSVPTLDEAVSPQEKLIAHMACGDGSGAVDMGSEEANTLLEHVQRTCDIERHREGTGEYGVFEGMINDARLHATLQHRFGPQHHWSVTQLNDYITCPFRFAAAHVLLLKKRAEPEEGLDTARRGQLYHAILAQAGPRWRAAQRTFTSDDESDIVQSVHTAADGVLAEAPTCYGFAPGVFWMWEQADIRRRLERALRRVIESSGDWAVFRPLHFEQSFGIHAGDPPLLIDTAVGPVLVRGRIDRIDQQESGRLAVLDYKSSSSPRSLTETMQGRDVQLTIYMLAAEQRLGQRVERAAFLHLGSGKISPPLTERQRDEAIAVMVERVTEAVYSIRSGSFAVRPRYECPTHCAFATICRLNIAKRDATKENG